MIAWLYILLGAAAVGLLLSRLEPRLPRLKEPLASRPDRSVEEIRLRYYADLPFDKEAFASLWLDIAEVFGVPPARMLPGDRFGFELPLSRTLIRDEDMELGTVVRNHAKRRGMPEPADDVRCVADVIRALGTTLPERRG